jgi:RimJ/RimL family protein N-acetyltransferase
MTTIPDYLFYRFEGTECVTGVLSSEYSWTIWKPSLLPMLPQGLPGFRLRTRFLFRWLVQRLHRFVGDSCGAVLIWSNSRLVHYSAFTPRYWRFPFLAEQDLQIGDTWTDPEFRGRGLALFALKTVISISRRPQRRFWYVVEARNCASIKVVEKAGFELIGKGAWIIPWGFKLGSSFVINDSLLHVPAASTERNLYA